MRPAGSFLFLQGPSSPLFARVAAHLEAAGKSCHRINLNVGDQLFWRRKGAVSYRGGIEAWASFIRCFIAENGIGTLILLGEERPYHAEAVRAAEEHGADVVVIEMGYLRPDWITVERDGMSSNSHFPRDPAVIRALAANLPQPDWSRKYSQSFLKEALCDLTYYLPSVFFGFLFPHYRFHGIFHPLAEYAGWVRRLATQRCRDRKATRIGLKLTTGEAPFFVYPLQLETDYQLRAHSPYASQRDAIVQVIESFAAHAPSDHKLAIKVHPLDNGLIDWGRLIEVEAGYQDIADRVMYLDGGELAPLIEHTRGIVTVNSTAALHGLKIGIPAIVLGTAVYDVAGMTDQRSLDDFWMSPEKPDMALVDAYFRLLAASIQERGNFYSNRGSAAAAQAIAHRLLNDNLNVPIHDTVTTRFQAG